MIKKGTETVSESRPSVLPDEAEALFPFSGKSQSKGPIEPCPG